MLCSPTVNPTRHRTPLYMRKKGLPTLLAQSTSLYIDIQSYYELPTLLDINRFKCPHFQIFAINYGLYFCRLCGETIALGRTNILKHWMDPKDYPDYFYPRYKNTRHVFLPCFEGIHGLEVGYNTFKEPWEVRIIGLSENYLYPSNKFSWGLSEDGGDGSEKAINCLGDTTVTHFPLWQQRG